MLREMIGFAAERLMALEVGMKTGASYGEKWRSGVPTATAIATATGKPPQRPFAMLVMPRTLGCPQLATASRPKS